MNTLTSKQRKLAYFGGIILLLVPIIYLGQPSTKEPGSGGQLAQLRQKYELGESTLGEVDPSGTAMNLVLLGLRGPAVTVLWLNAKDEKATKNWAKLRSTVDSIVQLQPHYKQIWRFQSWNLAYNVSSQWDAVEDRFFWVKEGAKFAMQGGQRNLKHSELPWDVGRTLGAKMGQSDEWKYFRQFYMNDPNDEKFGDDPDPVINPEGKDNYLTARDWYLRANERETAYGQEEMMRHLYRSYPSKSWQDYATALQKEGKFGEQTELAWQSAFESWVGEYGVEEIYDQTLAMLSQATPRTGVVKLESTAAVIDSLAASNQVPREAQKSRTEHYQNICHYRYWRLRTEAEKESLTVSAHRAIYDGRKLFHAGKTSPRGEEGDQPSEAEEMLEKGMERLARVFVKYPTFKYEDESLDEAMLAIYYWRRVHELNDADIPAEFPLKDLWDANQDKVMDARMQFARESAGFE